MERVLSRFPDTIFTPLTPPEANPGYIYDGFAPSKTTLPAGHVKEAGRRSFRVATVFEKDVAISMRDGITIYTDVFRPASSDEATGKVTAMIAWSPYGKSGGAQNYDRMGPFRCGVGLDQTSGYEKFEAPDPADWTARGYALLHVDARGTSDSEGDIVMSGEAEYLDVYDCIDWAARQPWCDGAVVMAGNSWLAISQIGFASRFSHPALKAIAPWEAQTDPYRDSSVRGGVLTKVPFLPIHKFMSGRGSVENMPAMVEKRPLFDEYWADKIADTAKIDIPVYLTASFSSGIHSRGSFESFVKAATPHKWLRVHPYQEWSDLYRPDMNDELQAFFDKFAKGKQTNFETVPRFRMSLLGFDGSDVDTIVERPEAAWPIPDTEQRVYYLNAADNTLVRDAPPTPATASYDSHHLTDCVDFRTHFDTYTELAGYPVARLFMSYERGDDMDVYVQVRKISRAGEALSHLNYVSCPVPAHEVPASNVSKHLGPDGQLRASHRVTLADAGESGPGILPPLPSLPFYRHDRAERVSHGDVVELRIPLWPIGMVFGPGEGILLRVAGHGLRLPELAAFALQEPIDMNEGPHHVHTGGEYASSLVVPVIRG